MRTAEVRRERPGDRPGLRHGRRAARASAEADPIPAAVGAGVGRLGQGVHPRGRLRFAPGDGHRPVPDARRGGEAAADPAARPPARRCISDAGRRRRPEGRPGDPRALDDHAHPDTYTSVYTKVAAEAAEAAVALVPRAGTSAHTHRTHPSPGTSARPGNPWSDGGASRARTDDLTDYESAALTN
jgi:hypothetical protein